MSEDAMDTPMKRCTKCGNEFPATPEYFSRNKTRKDGLNERCRKCKSIDDAASYLKHREARRAKGNAYEAAHREEAKARTKAWAKANPERKKTMDKAYSASHPEQNRERARKYRTTHRDITNQRVKEWTDKNIDRKRRQMAEWAKRNPDKVRATANRRFARKRRLPATFTDADWGICLDYWHNQCVYCRQSGRLFMEHYIPIASPDCPGTIATNMLPACRSCNISKNHHEPVAWLIRKFGELQANLKIQRIAAYFEWIASRQQEEH